MLVCMYGCVASTMGRLTRSSSMIMTTFSMPSKGGRAVESRARDFTFCFLCFELPSKSNYSSASPRSQALSFLSTHRNKRVLLERKMPTFVKKSWYHQGANKKNTIIRLKLDSMYWMMLRL